MIFSETEIHGAFVVDIEKRADRRGFFARAWCETEFAAHGLATRFAQANMAGSTRKGTLRGLHYQASPHAEAKLVRCTRGAIFDVVVDLRPESPTHLRWVGVELTGENHRSLYLPAGCAHGYQTISDDAEVLYLVTARYAPDAERGARYDDPAFSIDWPLPVSEISEKDRAWPLHAPPSDGPGEAWRRPVGSTAGAHEAGAA